MGNFSPPYSDAIKIPSSPSLTLLSLLATIAKQTKTFAIVSSNSLTVCVAFPAEINTRSWLEPIVCSTRLMFETNLVVYPQQDKLVIIYRKL